MIKKSGYFIFGGMIGAIIALLFAPKSGKESREDVLKTTRDIVNEPEEFKTKVKSYMKNIIDRLSEDEIIQTQDEIVISKTFDEEEE
ncbi:YtxH domain-containing protein [Tepidibacter hydrothermalis]|uniref:YtxH domain-containing protein n=1 Tax=Tepidibacter hydrothermalis TaxID=3036126 RepID=A0ABY8EBG7_9FIRM|nr:YtxH domain-containing protein [Tepidibacter hydrothermalis]WFD10296.1 YtxH domain-containing protein [Tepidibacter hydrothermalis]